MSITETNQSACFGTKMSRYKCVCSCPSPMFGTRMLLVGSMYIEWLQTYLYLKLFPNTCVRSIYRIYIIMNLRYVRSIHINSKERKDSKWQKTDEYSVVWEFELPSTILLLMNTSNLEKQEQWLMCTLEQGILNFEISSSSKKKKKKQKRKKKAHRNLHHQLSCALCRISPEIVHNGSLDLFSLQKNVLSKDVQSTWFFFIFDVLDKL